LWAKFNYNKLVNGS